MQATADVLEKRWNEKHKVNLHISLFVRTHTFQSKYKTKHFSQESQKKILEYWITMSEFH